MHSINSACAKNWWLEIGISDSVRIITINMRISMPLLAYNLLDSYSVNIM